MYTLRQYLFTLEDPRGLCRTLGPFELCRDASGRPCCSTGNSAYVFRIRRAGRTCALRCYARPTPRLRELYGPRLLPAELYLYTASDRGEWVDVVLDDWIEGAPLDGCIARAAEAGDCSALARLAGAFDRLALRLTEAEWAHGDLKPENILVEPSGALRLIDWDAMYRPEFAGRRSPELGTAAFQHPGRTADDFDARIDDFPAALIATALHALALDPTLWQRWGGGDELLFSPRQIARDRALAEVVERFAREGCAAAYRLARLLGSPTYRLPGLPRLFAALLGSQAAAAPDETDEEAGPDAVPELFVEEGLWGYRIARRVVVEPLYDCGFEYSEGLAAVRLGSWWHFLDTAGRTVLHCPPCDAVKPFRNGRALVVRGSRRTEIDRTGREFAVSG